MLTQKTLEAIRQLQSDCQKAEELRNFSLDRSASAVAGVISQSDLADLQEFAQYLVDATHQSLFEALQTLQADFSAIELYGQDEEEFIAEPVAVILDLLKDGDAGPALSLKLALLFRRAQRWLEVEGLPLKT